MAFDPALQDSLDRVEAILEGKALSDTNQADKAFLADMLGHHIDALKMVKKLGTKGQSKAVAKLAARIQSQQTKEIAVMKSLLGSEAAKKGSSGKHGG